MLQLNLGRFQLNFQSFDGVSKYKAESEAVKIAAKEFNVPASNVYSEGIKAIESKQFAK